MLIIDYTFLFLLNQEIKIDTSELQDSIKFANSIINI